jgi:hypothetical protein
MSLSDKIKKLEAEIISAKDSMVEIVKLADAENRDLTEVEAETIDTLKTTIDLKEKSSSGYKSALQTLATEQQSPSVVKSEHLGTAKSRKGSDMLFTKMATASFIAHAKGSRSVENTAQEIFPADKELHAVIKSAVNPANTLTSGWASDLVQQGYGDFIDTLRPMSFFAQLAGYGTQIAFGGFNTISLPSQSTVNDLAGSFVSEGALIPVKKTSYASKVLHRYKMGVISNFTREIAERSTPSIQAMITEQMLVDTALAIDTALISTNASVSNKSPAGLLNGVTAGTGSGATAQNVLDDIKALVTPLITKNTNPANIVILMNPLQELGLSFVTTAVGAYVFRDQIAQGRLNGYKVIVSNSIPAGEVIALDASSFASAFDAPEFRVSDTSTLVQANDVAPAPNVADQTSMTAVTSGSITSLFQQDLIAVRMLLPLSWVMRRDGYVTALTGVQW